MGFEDVVAVLGQAFNLELKVVQGHHRVRGRERRRRHKIETALLWSRMIADYRPAADSPDEPAEHPSDEWKPQGLGNFHVMQV